MVSPTLYNSEGCFTLPQEISVICSRPSTPPRSTKIPYSVIFLTTPSITLPSSIEARVAERCDSRSDSRIARLERTILFLFRLNFNTLKPKVCPTISSRLRIGRKSAWEPGRNAWTPTSTEKPPFTRLVITPSMMPSASWTSLIASHTLTLSAFSFERMTRSSSSSHTSIMTSTWSFKLTSTFPFSSLNSWMGIWPSDL